MTPAGPPSFFDSQEEEDQEKISYFSEDIDFDLPNASVLSNWLTAVVTDKNCSLDFLNFIFCTDSYLHRINVEYLNHDDLTDVITFPYVDPPKIQGDIFISIDRVRENASLFQVPLEQELHRVMVHGVLHLCGYQDKTPEESALMRKKEDESLAKLAAFMHP